MPTLREMQAAFARGVLECPLTEDATELGIASDDIAAHRRLAIYRNNVLLSLRRLLERTFPASRRLLGREHFAQIATAFVRAQPPEHPQLITYGASFPDFLGRFSECTNIDCIADVARLEWAREEAYYAADASPLSAADLAAIPVERYPALRFRLHPSLRLIRSQGPVHTLWLIGTATREEIHPPPFDAGPEQVLVVRPEMTVVTRPIAAADLILVEALGQGIPLAQAAARAQATAPGFDLEAALASHLAGGSFAGCG